MRTNLRSIKWVFQVAVWAFLVSAMALGLPSAALAADVTVDCDANDPPFDFTSITDALAVLDLEGPHTIFLKPGDCNENVQIIDRERLRIDATPLGDAWVVNPGGDGIDIINSRGIELLQLGAREASESGIFIGRDSEVHLAGLTVQGNDVGVFVTRNSTVIMDGNTVQNNNSDGLFVTHHSYVLVGGIELRNNGGSGMFCRDGSVCIVGGGLVAAGNGFAGIAVVNNALTRLITASGPNTIEGNGSYGVVMTRNSTLQLAGGQGNFIRANQGPGIEMDANSSLFMLNTTVSNNTGRGVNVLRLSTGVFVGGNSLTGNGGANLACDTTSLLSGDLTGISNISCLRIERTLGPPRPGNIQ